MHTCIRTSLYVCMYVCVLSIDGRLDGWMDVIWMNGRFDGWMYYRWMYYRWMDMDGWLPPLVV